MITSKAVTGPRSLRRRPPRLRSSGGAAGGNIPMLEQPLSGLKIVEIADSVSAALSTKLLADLGAEVVKLEKPETGDATRHLPPFAADRATLDSSLLFLYLNTNKLGVTLNIETPLGQSILHRLLKEADILVEDCPPDAAARLGVRYELLRRINAQLIMASITPFGQTGPYRDYRSTDLVTFHISGYGYITPGGGVDHPDAQPPLRVTGHISQFSTGIVSAVALMSGVFQRAATGVGHHIDVSEMEAGCHLGIGAIYGFLYSRINRNRIKSGIMGNVAILPARDGYVCFQGLRQYQWDALLEIMGGADDTTKEFFKSRANRIANWDAVELVMSQWTIQHTKDELTNMAQARGVPASPVNTPMDIVRSEQIAARAFLVDVEHPVAGTLKQPGPPFRFSETPWRVRHPAPSLGQHNHQVYCQRLGYSRQELARAHEAGAI